MCMPQSPVALAHCSSKPRRKLESCCPVVPGCQACSQPEEHLPCFMAGSGKGVPGVLSSAAGLHPVALRRKFRLSCPGWCSLAPLLPPDTQPEGQQQLPANPGQASVVKGQYPPPRRDPPRESPFWPDKGQEGTEGVSIAQECRQWGPGE